MGKILGETISTFTLFPFTASGMELDYDHHRMNIQIVSRIAERLGFRTFRNQEISRESVKCLEMKMTVHPATSKANLDSCTRKLLKTKLQKILQKTYREFVHNILSKNVDLDSFHGDLNLDLNQPMVFQLKLVTLSNAFLLWFSFSHC